MEPVPAQAPGIGAFGGVPRIDRQVKPLDIPTREQARDPESRRFFRLPAFWKKMSKFQQAVRMLFALPGLVTIGLGTLAAFVYKADGVAADLEAFLKKLSKKKPEFAPEDAPLKPWLADHPWVPEGMPQDLVEPWEPWTRNVIVASGRPG